MDDVVYLLRAPRDGADFSELPFVVLPTSEIPDFDYVREWRTYHPDRVRLLRGLDWFLQLPLDVFRLSLGFHDPFDSDDPIQFALRALNDRGTTVVVAAGNDGPEDGTLQELAQGDWVMSVGATDSYGKLLRRSSRGWVNGPFPTVVADGTDYMDHPFGPGTSFAAPRVAQVAGFLLGCLHVSREDFRSVLKGSWDPLGPLIPFPHLGFADTGLDPKLKIRRGPVATQLLSEGATGFQIGRDDSERRWYEGLNDALSRVGVACDVRVDPPAVRRTMELLARPIKLPRQLVGAGFVSAEIAVDFIRHFVPSRWMAIYCAEAVDLLGEKEVVELDSELGPLWTGPRVDLMSDVFLTGATISVARVAGANG